jgi:hypothetical protein
MWRQEQTSFLAKQTNTAQRAARKCRQPLPLPRALEIADAVAAPTDDIPAQSHTPRQKEGCCSAVVVVDVKVVAKLPVQLAAPRGIGLVAEAQVESPRVRARVRPRLERGMSGSRFPTEEPPSRI